MNPIELCYVCTPYRGANELEIERNILEGRALAVKVANETGMLPVSPVLNSAFFHRYEGKDLPNIDPAFWLDGYIVLLTRCDAIAAHGDMRWLRSVGCLEELKIAIDLARQGEMRIRIGETWIHDFDSLEKVVEEAKKGLPFCSRTAPSYCQSTKPYVPELSTKFLELPKKGEYPFYPKPDCRQKYPEGDETGMEQKALGIACAAHAGQVDKAGMPYIYHPTAVAAKFETSLLRTVALLHDVVEDTPVTLEDLEKQFPKEVIDAVDAITYHKGESKDDYLGRVMKNMTAREVKIADIGHNIGCLHLIADKAIREHLKSKYEYARAVLMGTSR